MRIHLSGVGAGVTGRRSVFTFRGGRLALPAGAFTFPGDGVTTRLAFVFAGGRLAFGFRLLALAFALAFLFGVGFFFGLSFAFSETLLLSELELVLVALLFVFEFAFESEFGTELSPLSDGRLMSTATVWPTLTISPACGN